MTTELTVETSVSGGKLAGVRVGGFDVAPGPMWQKVAEAIAAGLNGAPADLTVPALAARVRAAVPFGVDLIGATPTGIAEAVRQSVGGEPNPDRVGAFTAGEIERFTAGWRSLGWRVILERPLPPALNVALDEVLADRVAKSLRPPTIRFWGWTEPAVVIGRCQSAANEVDPNTNVTVVRRMTGGGAMFVQPAGAITYSLCLPESAVAGLSIRQSYEVCDAWAVLCLRSLGMDAHYIPVNDIGWASGKIAGAAQARRAGVVLHHTMMAYDLDSDEMAKVLRLGRERQADRAVTSAPKAVSPLTRQTALGREAIVGRLIVAFRNRYGGDDDGATADEMAAAERLVGEKYGTEAWTREFG